MLDLRKRLEKMPPKIRRLLGLVAAGKIPHVRVYIQMAREQEEKAHWRRMRKIPGQEARNLPEAEEVDMQENDASKESRDMKHVIVQERLRQLINKVNRLGALLDDLQGRKSDGEPTDGASTAEPFGPFWASLPDTIDMLAAHIEKYTEELRSVVL